MKHFSPRRVTWLGLITLLAARLGIEAILYRSGFVALTADDFGRAVVAGQWALSPSLQWSGIWLPFHKYLYGSVLMALPHLLWTPRGISIVLGLASIVIMYHLGSELFDKRIGMLSAAWMAVNPAHVWLSSVPLTEMLYTVLILGCTFGLVRFLKNDRRQDLFWSALWLGLANGIRYEGWMFSIAYSLFLAILLLRNWRTKRTGLKRSLGTLAIAGLPWIFPLAWLMGNYLATGNSLSFMQSITAYKTNWYANLHSYGFYLLALVWLDWLATFLEGFALVASLIVQKRRATLGYVITVVAPFAVFAFLHGGQIEPFGNFVRYLAPFQFMLYPACAASVVWGISKVSASRRVCAALSAAVLTGIVLIQVRQIFSFRNDPAGEGLAVGQKIVALRSMRPEIASQAVIVERVYWQYVAIQVGANDLTQVLFDREHDPKQQRPSLILENWDAFQECLAKYQVSYIAIQTPELRQTIEQKWMAEAESVVNGYAFYRVPLEIAHPEAGAICPLK